MLKRREFPKVLEMKVNTNALVKMLLDSIGRFRKECYGYLFGSAPSKINLKPYLVNDIFSFEMMKVRKNTEVEPTTSSIKRIDAVLEQLDSKFTPIGFYHSHPEWSQFEGSISLSEEDKKGTLKEGFCIDIVISIKKKKKLIPWRHLNDGTVKGTLGDYSFHVAAHFTKPSERNKKLPETTRMKIVCKKATRYLNGIQKLFQNN